MAANPGAFPFLVPVEPNGAANPFEAAYNAAKLRLRLLKLQSPEIEEIQAINGLAVDVKNEYIAAFNEATALIAAAPIANAAAYEASRIRILNSIERLTVAKNWIDAAAADMHGRRNKTRRSSRRSSRRNRRNRRNRK